MEKTVYEILGGFTVVRKIVVDFYNNVLEVDDLAQFFATTNMERQIDHQAKFISMLLGGPASFTDQQLRTIHEDLGIKDHHFDMIKEILADTFEDFDVAEDHIHFVVGEFEKRRSLIVI